MKRFFIWGVLAAALLSATSCSKDEEENQPITAVVDFEGEAWKEFVALNVGSTYSSEVVTADYLWQDEATSLTPNNITAEWDGVSYLSSGFAVSSFNSNCLEKFNIYGAYLRDLYVYNAENEDATKGGGNGGSDNFLVGYGNYEGDESGEWGDEDFRPTLTFADGKARTIQGCYVNSTTYFVSITELGNEFSPALQAGEKINTVPATCRIGYDWRLVPELSVGWAKDQIVAACEKVKAEMPGSDYSVIWRGADDPTLVPKDTDLVETFFASGKTYLGKEMEFSVSPGMDDQKYVVQKGKLETCIVYGPGRLTLAHKADEYVNIEEMKTAAKIMALSAVNLLGLEE